MADEPWTAEELLKHEWRPVIDFTDFVGWGGSYGGFPPGLVPFQGAQQKRSAKAVLAKVKAIGEGRDQYSIEFETAEGIFEFFVPRPYMSMLFSAVLLNEHLHARRARAQP